MLTILSLPENLLNDQIQTLTPSLLWRITYAEVMHKANENCILATAEDVGIFLRTLNDGSVFDEVEQEIYPYVFDHGGIVTDYQSLAEYHEDIDTVVVQLINTPDFNGYEWNLPQITINRIIKILSKKTDL